MKQFLTQYWLQIIFGGMLGFIVKYIKRYVLVERALQSLLRDRIVNAYNRAMDKGYCRIYEQENISAMYDEYHKLGGNGTITRLMKEIRMLPTEPFEERGEINGV